MPAGTGPPRDRWAEIPHSGIKREEADGYGPCRIEAQPEAALEQLITKATELDMDQVRASLPAPSGA
jgi:hypothetical protein